MTARKVLALCDRWMKTPDEILAMTSEALHMLELERLAEGGSL